MEEVQWALYRVREDAGPEQDEVEADMRWQIVWLTWAEPVSGMLGV